MKTHTRQRIQVGSFMLTLFTVAMLPGAVHAQTVSAGPEIEPHVVGGSETTPNSRPYQVALLMNGRQGCGGTLISPEWVLTAAHCLDSASTSTLTVQVGAHSISRRDGQNLRVSQIIKHENWRGAQGIQSGWDIAVLRLATPAAGTITPAVLPTVALDNQLAAVGRAVTVSGWGLTRNQGSPSDVLREVNLPVISNASCSTELRTSLPASVICGGGSGGVSACNGDSGGPYATSSGGKFYSIGTVSWGNACSGATVFTRTSSYLSWIEQKTGVKPDGGGGVDQKPVARFTASVNGLNVSFSDASTDDKGIRSWSWNFGDGSALSNQSSPSYSYSADGSYNVTLTVTDTANQTHAVSQLVQVRADGDPTGCEGVSAWNASTAYQLRDLVSYQQKKYQASWWSTGARPDLYANVWTLLGNCTGGGNTAPVADFSFVANQLNVSFSDRSTDDTAVVSWLWQFGNGSSSTQPSPTTSYAQAGSYKVQLTVKDAAGLSHTVSKTVIVTSGDTGGNCAGLPVWSSTAVYNAGVSVQHSGSKYTARWWSQSQNPSNNSGPWQVWEALGACQ
ncbi:trypsin-like serine protease [Rheinheimera riviphila]|nr:trypsin-like serine protease [Rheinheimera riviphila]